MTTQETTEAQVVVDALEAITDTTGAGDNWCSGVPFVVMEQLHAALPIARAQAQREQAQAARVASAELALEAITDELAKLPKMPKAYASMNEYERVMSDMASSLVATLMFARDQLSTAAGPMKPQGGAPNAGGEGRE